MLNNKAIAQTVADVIRDCDDCPISIGVHGDWGAGKSSVLVMVEDELKSKADKENDIVCIRFNGWQQLAKMVDEDIEKCEQYFSGNQDEEKERLSTWS